MSVQKTRKPASTTVAARSDAGMYQREIVALQAQLREDSAFIDKQNAQIATLQRQLDDMRAFMQAKGDDGAWAWYEDHIEATRKVGTALTVERVQLHKFTELIAGAMLNSAIWGQNTWRIPGLTVEDIQAARALVAAWVEDAASAPTAPQGSKAGA